jgi:hypothetical protein
VEDPLAHLAPVGRDFKTNSSTVRMHRTWATVITTRNDRPHTSVETPVDDGGGVACPVRPEREPPIGLAVEVTRLGVPEGVP